MALTEEQEAKLLQLLSAYENGKRVGDLPEVTPGKDSAGLMVEVVDTDGESKKFDLGNVAPVSDKKQLWALVRPSSLTTPGAFFWIDLPGRDSQFDEDDDEKIWAVLPDGYKFGDELVLCSQNIDGTPDLETAVTETILSSTFNGEIGNGVIVTSSPDNGVATYIFDNFSGRRSVSEPPALNITSFGEVQPTGSRRLLAVDRKGFPMWTDEKDPYGVVLTPDEYDRECAPLLDEAGEPILHHSGLPIFKDTTSGVLLIQRTRDVIAFVPWDDFDVTRLQIGRCVAIMPYNKSAVANTNWFITEFDEKGFTVRNAKGDNTLQFFYEGEFYVGDGVPGIEKGTRLMTLAIGDGHFYKLGNNERVEGYDYPYGNDLYTGGRYTFLVDSKLFGVNSPRAFTGFVIAVNGHSATFEGFDDYEGLNVQLELTNGGDGFWSLSDPDFYTTVLGRTRPDYFYSHMIPLRDYATLSSMVEGGFTNDCGQIVRGLVNPALSGDSLYESLSVMKGLVPLGLFNISIMNSDGETIADNFRLKPIQGGALDMLSSGYTGVFVVEFYLIAPNGQMYFVRLAYDSENNILEDESVIPDGVYI